MELADAEELVTHAIHPYTRSLLSAIPMPSPRRERQKKLLVYDPAMHDYSTESPVAGASAPSLGALQRLRGRRLAAGNRNTFSCVFLIVASLFIDFCSLLYYNNRSGFLTKRNKTLAPARVYKHKGMRN